MNDGFVENSGQWDEDILFLSSTGFGHVGIMRSGILLNIIEHYDDDLEKCHILEIDLLDTNPVKPRGYERIPHLNNFLIGNDPELWITGARCYDGVIFPDIWDDIDLKYFFNGPDLKYEFILRPGSDPLDIKMKVDGHKGLVKEEASLRFDLGDDISFSDSGLKTFYQDDMEKTISSDFRLIDENTYSFQLEQYDPDATIIIDPLLYSTFIGGSNDDWGTGVCVDSSGNAYVTGQTKSSNFPRKTGAYDSTYNSNIDIFVSKMNPSGSSLSYSTYVGGSSYEQGSKIFVDSSGNAYVTGWTQSTNFPVSSGAYDTSHNGGYDAFVFKLNSTGSGIYYSTFVGGTGSDYSNDIKVDDDGRAHLVGSSFSTNFPTTTGAYSSTMDGVADIVAFKLEPDGTALNYSTYIGGNKQDFPGGLDLDDNGTLYVTGSTYSSDFPTTSNCYDSSYGGNIDLVLFKLNVSGDSLLYSTFVGGTSSEYGRDMVLGGDGSIFVAGTGGGGFPTTQGAFDRTANGWDDVIVFKMNSSGDYLHYSTYIGGSSNDFGYGISVDDEGNAFVTGYTGSSNFPTVLNSFDRSYNGGNDMFIVKMDPKGSYLCYSSFIGGSNWEFSKDIDLGDDGKAFVTGYTRSSNFQTTSGSYDSTYNGGNDDAFLVKVNFTIPPFVVRDLDAEFDTDYANLTWDPPAYDGESPILGYKLYRGNASGDTSLLKVLDRNTTFFNDTSFSFGKIFFYNVTAYNSVGESDSSEELRISEKVKPVFSSLPKVSSWTTGEWLNLSVNVSDNVMVKGVTMLSWFGTGSTSNSSISWKDGNRYFFNISIPFDETEILHFTFSANDSSENWNTTPRMDVNIIDNDDPVIISDLSPETATTGDGYTFSISASDNIGITSAIVEYWFASGLHTNSSMTGTSTYSYTITIPSDDLSSLYCRYHLQDGTGNGLTSNIKEIFVEDNDEPVFGIDSTPTTGYTGNTFMFNVSISDNIELKNATVEYWYGNEEHVNMTMEEDGNFHYKMNINSNSTSSMRYRFHSNDSSGNWGRSTVKSVTIVDDDLPVFVEDTSPSSCSTGDTFVFAISVHDNVQVSSVTVEYWFGSGIHMNSSMLGIDPYEKSIIIPSNSLETLKYIFHAVDSSGNWIKSWETNVTVIDNDKPKFGIDMSPVFGTTGDVYQFNISVTDNIGIDSVYLEYWQGNDSHVNASIDGTSYYSHNVTLSSNSTETLHYIFRVVDDAGLWCTAEQVNVSVMDNDPPEFGIDRTPISGTTGDGFIFNASISDNIGIQNVTVEYWFGNSTHVNSSLWGSDIFSLMITLPANSTESLHYIIHAKDKAGNNAQTSPVTVLIMDNDLPEFEFGNIGSVCTTGDWFDLEILVDDNTGISMVILEYWFEDGDHVNVTLQGNGTYTHTLAIPSNSSADLHWRFHGYDIHGNSNISEIRRIKITDNDIPYLLSDLSDTIATTGDQYVFNIILGDNIEIDNVWIEYWFGSDDHVNRSLEGGLYLSVEVPLNSVLDLFYIVHFNDTSGNWNSTQTRNVTVIDNDIPVFGEEVAIEFMDHYDIILTPDIRDNIALDRVWIEYWFPEWGPHFSENLTISSSKYSHRIEIPFNVTELRYIIHAQDIFDHRNSTMEMGVIIPDVIKPGISDVHDITIYLGWDLISNCSGTDNIGIEEMIWMGDPAIVEDNWLIGIPEKAGTFMATFMVFDQAGNNASILINITILPVDHDIDGDGIPDLVEMEKGLDINNSEDGILDPDNDGLTNLEEYLNGTDMENGDTDGDGMPDKWEIDHDLDPLTFSAENDEDGDGKSDLGEFRDGTDPNVEEFDPVTLIIGISLAGLVVSIITGILIFFLIRKSGNRNDQQDDVEKEE